MQKNLILPVGVPSSLNYHDLLSEPGFWLGTSVSIADDLRLSCISNLSPRIACSLKKVRREPLPALSVRWPLTRCLALSVWCELQQQRKGPSTADSRKSCTTSSSWGRRLLPLNPEWGRSASAQPSRNAGLRKALSVGCV